MSNKILKSTLLFSSFVLFAQVIGLVRDLYLVRFFGVGPILDTYYLAFKIPDLMNVFYSVFLGSVIFIPLLTRVKVEGGNSAMQKEISKVGSLVLLLVITVALILYIVMPQLVQLLAPSWNAEQLEMLAYISRILLIAQLFFPIGILAGAIGMVQDKPLGMAVSGAVYNIFILLGAVFLTPFFGIYGVVYGIIAGAICFALVQIAPKETRNILKHFRFEFKFTEWITFVKKNSGRFLTVLLNQAFYIVILVIAAAAGTGSVTIFSNAFNIYLAIFFVMGASFSTAIMPHNSRLHVEKRDVELKDSLHTSMVYMFSVSIFFTIFSFIFSKDIIQILYYFSNLKESEMLHMTAVFTILSLSIPLLNLSEIARKYMYSADLIKYSATVIASVLFFMLIFNKLFLNLGIENLIALSLAFLIANILALVITLALLSYLGRLQIPYVVKNTYKSLLVFFATIPSFIFVYPYVTDGIIDFYPNYLLDLAVSATTLLIIYLLFVYMLNDKTSKDIIKKITSVVV